MVNFFGINNKFFLVKVFIILVVIILVLGSSFAVAASYNSWDIPIASRNLERKITYLVASIPFIPKTSEQIVIKAFQDSQNIETMHNKIDVELSSGGYEFGSLSINGKTDIRNLNKVLIESDIKGFFGENNAFRGEVSIVQLGDELYFKIGEAPKIEIYNLDSLKDKWYKINLDDVSYVSQTNTISDSDVKRDLNSKMLDTLNLLDREGIFSKVERLQDEKIGGRDSYNLSFALPADTLTKLFREVYEIDLQSQNFAEILDKTTITLWVDKGTFFINKLQLNTGFKQASPFVNTQFSDIDVKVSYELSNINENLVIKAPEQFEEFESIFDLLLRVQPLSVPPNQQFLGASINSDFLSQELLFYERLLHLINLLPASL